MLSFLAVRFFQCFQALLFIIINIKQQPWESLGAGLAGLSLHLTCKWSACAHIRPLARSELGSLTQNSESAGWMWGMCIITQSTVLLAGKWTIRSIELNLRMFKNPNTGHVFAEPWFFFFRSSNSQQLSNQASINCIFPDLLFGIFCDFKAIPDLHLSDDMQSFFNGAKDGTGAH